MDGVGGRALFCNWIVDVASTVRSCSNGAQGLRDYDSWTENGRGLVEYVHVD
jgi:hypothetical protein